MIDVGQLCRYEAGHMRPHETDAFFQELLDTGLIHDLQGHYRRVAQALIEAGRVSQPEAPR